jgi:hypothetical protein
MRSIIAAIALLLTGTTWASASTTTFVEIGNLSCLFSTTGFSSSSLQPNPGSSGALIFTTNESITAVIALDSSTFKGTEVGTAVGTLNGEQFASSSSVGNIFDVLAHTFTVDFTFSTGSSSSGDTITIVPTSDKGKYTAGVFDSETFSASSSVHLEGTYSKSGTISLHSLGPTIETFILTEGSTTTRFSRICVFAGILSPT